jgi:hypothetical protein
MDSEDEKNLKTLELADKVRQFEIGLFWTRSLFFWGFSTTALAAYGAAFKAHATDLQFGARVCWSHMRHSLDFGEPR